MICIDKRCNFEPGILTVRWAHTQQDPRYVPTTLFSTTTRSAPVLHTTAPWSKLPGPQKRRSRVARFLGFVRQVQSFRRVSGGTVDMARSCFF
jgi:hypothetical protein